MTRAQKILGFMREQGGGWVTTPQTAEALGLNRDGISSQLRELFDRGLVTRRDDPDGTHGRMLWQITAAGRHFLDHDAQAARWRTGRRQDGYGADGGILLERYWPG
jgi:predicted ArsR family transcriptional regulator